MRKRNTQSAVHGFPKVVVTFLLVFVSCGQGQSPKHAVSHKQNEEFATKVREVDLLDVAKTEHVSILGRRGPHQIAMTPKELGELGHLERASPRVDPADLPDAGDDGDQRGEINTGFFGCAHGEAERCHQGA